MSKRAISLTLQSDNLAWLRGRVLSQGNRSVSELLDHLIAEARTRYGAQEQRSVVGTISIASTDPDLATADQRMRRLFRSLGQRPATNNRSLSTNPSRRSRG